ncbi:hypothetical protein FTV88_0500 [Heliorestis convoluta]|uniref:Uncharacterized protein n=1 Tax=Heliorestis convoluta TaxID=356322 RepID=A0A5Q2MZ26_9FIRM|nr:hypothetical protein FTV88_0500 [Heliorestis convoluta]
MLFSLQRQAFFDEVFIMVLRSDSLDSFWFYPKESRGSQKSLLHL